jgi:hypothetical protein
MLYSNTHVAAAPGFLYVSSELVNGRLYRCGVEAQWSMCWAFSYFHRPKVQHPQVEVNAQREKGKQCAVECLINTARKTEYNSCAPLPTTRKIRRGSPGSVALQSSSVDFSAIMQAQLVLLTVNPALRKRVTLSRQKKNYHPERLRGIDQHASGHHS